MALESKKEISYVDLMARAQLAMLTSEELIAPPFVAHIQFIECPSCYGETEVLSQGIVRMQDCYWCKGSGRVSLLTAAAIRSGNIPSTEDLAKFYSQHQVKEEKDTI